MSPDRYGESASEAARKELHWEMEEVGRKYKEQSL